MKKIILIFVILFFNSNYSQENSIFWKIQKDSIISYIIGTNHIFDKTFIEKDNTIISALDKSSIVFLENIESKDSIINSRTNFNYIDILSNKERKILKEIIDSNLNSNKLTNRELHLKVQSYWDKKSCLKDQFCSDKISMDGFIKNYSQKNNKKVIGLEKISETLNFIETEYLKNADESKIVTSLRYKLNEIDKGSISKNCTYNELYKEKKCNYNFSIEVFDSLLNTRNNNWFIKIQKALESNEPVFIAVGLAHLDFKNGLISMLQEKGYVVTSINL